MASAAAARAQVIPFSKPWTWPKKRGKPRYWQWERNPDADETEFDHECRRLKLYGASLLKLASSPALRLWAKRNCRHRYIPTDLLDAWGIVVNFETEMPGW
jgi:hypothetical protein